MKAVIFDFDGTLANTLPICYRALQHVFQQFDNKNYSVGEIVAMFGPTEPGIIRENLVHSEKDRAIDLFFQEYTEHHDVLVEINLEMNKLLQFLKDKGVKVGIVTGKARRSLTISLQKLQMDTYFDISITGDDVTKPKPDPEGINKVLTYLGISREDAMYVGDSDADIKAGKHAGVSTVGAHWLDEVQTTHFDIEPDRVYDCINDLYVFLQKKVEKVD